MLICREGKYSLVASQGSRSKRARVEHVYDISTAGSTGSYLSFFFVVEIGAGAKGSLIHSPFGRRS